MIRQVLTGDTDQLVALWTECDLVRPWNDPRRDIERKLAVADDLFLVTEIDGSIVGSVMGGYDGHRGWIYYLAVAPDHRRQGLGRALVAEVEHRLLARGCPKLNLQVRLGNEATLDFYQRLNYATDDVVGLGKRLITDFTTDN